MEIRPRDLDLKTPVGDFMVSTVALGIEHHGGMWYETMVFPQKDGEITDWNERYCDRYMTKGAAEKGHECVVADLTAGTLTLYGGDPDAR